MFSQPANSHTTINIQINPLTCFNGPNDSKREYLKLLLFKLIHNPASIVEKRIEGNNKLDLIQLSAVTKKLEKQNHFKSNRAYQVSYLIEDENGQSIELSLDYPIKVFKKKDDVSYFAVINENLGKGGIGSVKAANIFYWLENDKLNFSQGHLPLAVKTIKLEKHSTDKLVQSELRKMLFAQKEVGKAYLGQENLDLYIRNKYDGTERFEIFMPQFQTTLEKLLTDGMIEELSFSKRLALIKNIAVEINDFHKKTGNVHQDIKPENIAINPATLEVKLIDFDTVNKIGTEGRLSETRLYLDTEIIQAEKENRNIASKVSHDYYSFGLVIALILLPHKKFAVQNKEDCERLNDFWECKILESLTTEQNEQDPVRDWFNDNRFFCSEEICELIKGMIQRENRIGFDQILKKINHLIDQYQELETNDSLYATMNVKDQYKLATIQLLASCNDDSKQTDARKIGLKILRDVQSLKIEPKIALTKLTATLRSSKEVIDNPSYENLEKLNNQRTQYAKFPYAKILKTSLYCLLGIGLMIAGIIGLASSPISLFGIIAGTTIASQIAFGFVNGATAVAGSSMFGAISNLFYPFNRCHSKEKTIKKDLEELTHSVKRT